MSGIVRTCMVHRTKALDGSDLHIQVTGLARRSRWLAVSAVPEFEGDHAWFEASVRKGKITFGRQMPRGPTPWWFTPREEQGDGA